MNTNEDKLIESYLSGNKEAFSQLVNTHLSSIYNFSFRLSGNESMAEDITQETFIKLWKNLSKYRAGEGFKSWLFTIARNTAIDYLRKRSPSLFSDMSADGDHPSFGESIPDVEPLPDELFARNDEEGRLTTALMALSPENKEILTLHYEEGLTFDEIGKILHKPLHTVKSQHRRALMRLRAILVQRD